MSALKSGQTAARFSPQELRRYREQFQAYDLNKDGVISVMEMLLVTRNLGYRLSPEAIKVGLLVLLDRTDIMLHACTYTV